jgi:hypothetical protein
LLDLIARIFPEFSKQTLLVAVLSGMLIRLAETVDRFKYFFNLYKVIEFLEKNYKENFSIEEALKVTCKALLDVVESGSKNIEITVLTLKEFRYLTEEEVEKLVANVN